MHRYANRARNIKNKPVVNVASSDGGAAECAALRSQVCQALLTRAHALPSGLTHSGS